MKAEISIEFPDEKSAIAAEKAVSHEGIVGSRSTSDIRRNGKQVTVKISAKDTVALRATMNAFMREFQVFEDVGKRKI
jgi:tRNA threonylcarbamoyladenosine modification (KEOPS) complex  Pcc1 subunit